MVGESITQIDGMVQEPEIPSRYLGLYSLGYITPSSVALNLPALPPYGTTTSRHVYQLRKQRHIGVIISPHLDIFPCLFAPNDPYDCTNPIPPFITSSFATTVY
jgi:hypothetical protein